MGELMTESLQEKIATTNQMLASLLNNTRKALRGEGEFGLEQVRALSAPIAEMNTIVRSEKELCAAQPEIANEIATYKTHLHELQAALEQIRIMLLARRNQMEAGHVQLHAVTQWAAALQQTR
jgi:uncharacterized coiled-coil DUF342 family protein